MLASGSNQSQQTNILVVAWIWTSAAVLAVTIKLFTRVRIIHALDWDDLFIFLSLILSVIASSLVHYGVLLGFGRHTSVVMAEFGDMRLSETAKFQMLGYPFNIGAFSLPNISITILVCNILDHNARRTILLYTMSTLQVVFATITIVLAFAQCDPTARLWDKTLRGSCWSPRVLNYFSYWLCAYTAFTDVILAVIPIRTFWKLQMPKHERIGLCLMMSMTMLSAIVTVVKGTYLHLFTGTADPLYDPVPLVLWGLVEQNIVIITACIPTIRPFLRKLCNRSVSTKDSNTHIRSHFDAAARGSSPADFYEFGTSSDVALRHIEHGSDTASQVSQHNILRTFDLEMHWSPQAGIGDRSARVPPIPGAQVSSDPGRR